MHNTPFFPEWRHRLAPMGRRLGKVRQHSLVWLEKLFEEWIEPDALSQERKGNHSRQRIFTLRRTFWGFLYQALNPSSSCREVVRQVQALLSLHSEEPFSVDANTSAYCQARSRLPLARLKGIRHTVAEKAERRLSQARQYWHGLKVKVIDGTSTTLPDTPKNQKIYPQSRSQKPGCGFPLMKLVGIFSLGSGVLLDYAKGNKHRHEISLLQELLGLFGPGDLALADRGFSSYVSISLLIERGAQCLFRLHQARKADFRKGRRLGRNDRLLTWKRPAQKPKYLPLELWLLVPETLSVRMVRFRLDVPGYRSQEVILVTTLIDPKKFSARELAELYARRWRVELWFRDIKTTMGMEALRCQSPQMAHKEVEMYLIAYNLIRAIMVAAGSAHDVPIESLSFKGSVDSTRQYSIAIAQAPTLKKQRQLRQELLRVIALDCLPNRPGRREPRAVKRRPKPYALLNKHRKKFKETSHRNRYWKNNPRKARRASR